MPNPKMTFRIWTDAQAKLFEEMSHYRGDKPPFGQFISPADFDVPAKVMERSAGEDGREIRQVVNHCPGIQPRPLPR